MARWMRSLRVLLGALAVPFQKSRSNDDLRYEADILGLVSFAADLALTQPWPQLWLALVPRAALLD